MSNRYLLTTGESTTKIEVYILDLFKLYLSVLPDEIPNSSIGFSFNLTNVAKDQLLSTIRSRISNLISTIQSKFKSVNIKMDSLELIDEEKVRLKITVNDSESRVFEQSII